MKAIHLFRLLFLAVGLVIGVAELPAQDAGVRARMAQRLPSVDALKDRHAVGENNRGYLEARASLTPADEKIVSDENADRASAYKAIASQTGSTPDAVGRARAQKIMLSSKRGVWVQAPDGAWSQKS